MAEIELGLYHYKLIYSIITILESSKLIKNTISDCFYKITVSINPDLSILFLYDEQNKLKPFLSQGIEIEKIKEIDWEKDGIISKTIEYSLPIKTDSLIQDKNLKNTYLVLPGLGYKLDSIISIPISYDKNNYGLLFFANKEKKFTPHEFETLKIISSQISYHFEINDLTEQADKKCKYFSVILDQMSSGIIIYSANNLKFMNKKAEIITEREGVKNENLLNLIKEIVQNQKSVSRMETNIIFGGKSKLICYSANFAKINGEDTVILVFQDITQFAKR